MTYHQHTFYYTDKHNFFQQLDEMLTKLEGDATLTPYHQVRIRYPHLSDSAFTMRLKRFKGTFPHERGPKGEKIIRLFVTRALDAYLRK